MAALECPCFFVCNESISATPASTFEQIPLSLENVNVLPSVFWFSFGNTRIAVQSRRVCSITQNSSVVEPVGQLEQEAVGDEEEERDTLSDLS